MAASHHPAPFLLNKSLSGCDVVGRCNGYRQMDTELELVERARAGDREAFARLVESYQRPLAGYLVHLLGDRELALDLTQETFVRAYSGLRQTSADLRLRAWLFRIATNLGLDALRRRRRIGWLPLSVVEHRAADAGAPPLEERELVRAALSRLSPDDQALLVLCGVEQYAYAEVALSLGTTPDAVRKRLSRAKARFRQSYEEVAGDAG
jgi:RNA polymerase sigma-70 factor, ECF subfamily